MIRVNDLVKVSCYPLHPEGTYMKPCEQDIAVVTRVKKTFIEVRFRHNIPLLKIKPYRIEKVDTSYCTTVPYSLYKNLEKKEIIIPGCIFIIGNSLICLLRGKWSPFGVISDTDLKKYPLVVTDEEHNKRVKYKKFGI